MSREIVRTIVKQIGNINFAAISGGRIRPIPGDGYASGVEFPVAYGYSVRVRYDEGSDTYTVERVLVRGGKTFEKGTRTNVYCDELGEKAYRAACFRSYDETEW